MLRKLTLVLSPFLILAIMGITDFIGLTSQYLKYDISTISWILRDTGFFTLYFVGIIIAPPIIINFLILGIRKEFKLLYAKDAFC